MAQLNPQYQGEKKSFSAFVPFFFSPLFCNKVFFGLVNSSSILHLLVISLFCPYAV